MQNMSFKPNLSKDEICNLYRKGYSIQSIASILMNKSELFTVKGARAYVEKTIYDMQIKENLIL